MSKIVDPSCRPKFDSFFIPIHFLGFLVKIYFANLETIILTQVKINGPEPITAHDGIAFKFQ
jgi:hypothetical protein